MFFELTDLLVCPRCGPQHGLVLLVQEVRDRRVKDGWLGCPNCRTDFAVKDGVAQLSLHPDSQRSAFNPFEEDELALKVLALSGLAEKRGVLVLGPRLSHVAAGVSELAPEVEVVVIEGGEKSGVSPGISRIICDDVWPIVEGRADCVAIAAGGDKGRVAMASRLVRTGGRLLVFDAQESDTDEARRCGLGMLAAEAGTAVAEKRSGSLPIIG